MPDAKSLLPGRAFRSEHAQLRPEPHSIASHGPAPMDPLQTTRMRNGVLYAAEWPCCHDPLRLSLGSEDPFYQTTHAFGARGCATPPPLFGCGGGRARRARRVRAPPPRAGRRAPNAQAPFPLPSLNPAARALPRARARGVASPRLASTWVCPSLHVTPPLTPQPTPSPPGAALPNPSSPPFGWVLLPLPQTPPLLPPTPTPHASDVSFTPTPTLWPYPSFISWPAHRRVRPRTSRTRIHTAPQLSSSPALTQTAPPPQGAGGLASRARRRRRALRGRAAAAHNQPSGGLHARRSHPAH